MLNKGHCHPQCATAVPHPAASGFRLRWRAVRLAAVAVAIVAAAIPARALGTAAEAALPAVAAVPPSNAAPAVEQKTAVAEEERWYGGTALMAEGAGVGLVIVGGVMTNQPGPSTPALGKDLIAAGVAMWFLGPPVNHVAYGHVGRGFESLGLRLGAFLVPVAAGFLLAGAINHGGGVLCIGDPPPQDCSAAPAAIIGLGVLGGIIAVTLYDDGSLARDTVAPRATGLSLVPRLRLGRDEAVLSLAARF